MRFLQRSVGSGLQARAPEWLAGRMAKRTSPPSKETGSEQEPMRTKTLPEAMKGGWFEGTDVVTALEIYGTGVTFELPREQKTFTIGASADRDIALPDKFLSALHCVLDRRGNGLRVHDQGSYNGTFFAGRRENTFDLRPGDTFTAASVRFLAMNDEMRAAMPVFGDLIGTDEGDEAGGGRKDSSDLVLVATSGTHVLITGDPGSGQALLARTIHGISLLRGRPLVELDSLPEDRRQQRAIIDRASRSTLVITIGVKSPVMDAAFVSMVFSPSFHIRVIVIAPSASKAEDVLGAPNVRSMRTVFVPPLALRSEAIPRLLDRLLADRGVILRVGDLTPENQTALQTYAWPANLADLQVAADRLIAIARDGSLLRASKSLGVSNSTLHYWFSQVGMSLPLVTAG